MPNQVTESKDHAENQVNNVYKDTSSHENVFHYLHINSFDGPAMILSALELETVKSSEKNCHIFHSFYVIQLKNPTQAWAREIDVP